MKTRLIYILFSGLLFIAASCQSKNKPAAPIETDEDVSILASDTDEIVIEKAVEESSIIEETIVEPIEEPEPKDVGEKILSNTKTNTTEPSTTKAKDIVKTIKEAVVEPVSKPVTKPETNVSISKHSNTSTPKTNKSTTELPTKTEKVKEIAEEKTEAIIKTKPEKPIIVDVPVGYPNHKLFDSFLGKYVSNSGNVNYAEIKKNEASLDAYLITLENTKFNTTWSREDKLAFWINAYNAYTIKLILNNYPVAKITDLHGGKPWDHKWIKLTGKTLSLNNIENDIIRPEFKEPRIHFAVNCAAKSCPPILNAAYTAGNLESKLESQTKKFVNNSAFNTLGKSEITISKIFDWYGSDFGDVASYIARYAETAVKPTAKVKFKEYDWNLNGK